MTIEHALGIEANSLKTPDYKGIELKSAREKAKAQKTVQLFSLKLQIGKLAHLKIVEKSLINMVICEMLI
jgi:hypothetical protein